MNAEICQWWALCGQPATTEPHPILGTFRSAIGAPASCAGWRAASDRPIGARGYMTPEHRQRIIRRMARKGDNTAYAFTKGMTKTDALQFWNDARAIGLVTKGVNTRGTKLFGFPAKASK